MEIGAWYYLVLPFGWVLIGRYTGEREGISGHWFAQARFIRNASTNHGEASKSLPSAAETRTIGKVGRVMVNLPQAIWITETAQPAWGVADDS